MKTLTQRIFRALLGGGLALNVTAHAQTQAEVDAYRAALNGSAEETCRYLDQKVQEATDRAEALRASRSQSGAVQVESEQEATFTFSSLESDSGSGSGSEDDSWNALRNYQKFAAQTFMLVDTNIAAQNDTNLYHACVSFPADTNTVANLQIKRYGANAVIIKANHFDYSAETDRDFALLVCDSPERPTWKSIDLSGSSNGQDGWLIQGLVPRWKVSDPMFMVVSGIASNRAAFIRAIPYSGPQISLSGPNAYDTVSNITTLQAAVSDLSGTTNHQFFVTVDGTPARYALGTSNTISVDTRYSPPGTANIYVDVGTIDALIFDPTNPPDNTKLSFDTTVSLPLDFENSTFVAFASDMCSPDVGTNYMMFGIDRAQNVAASIKEPTSGRTVKSYSGYVPYPATVEIAWDLKETNGAPYTNDSYSVAFQAQAAGTTLTVTNRISRAGVRAGAGSILTWEEENPSSGNGSYLNDQAWAWVGQTLFALYHDIYSSLGLTQYTPAVVGANRNIVDFFDLSVFTDGAWHDFLRDHLTNGAAYSDITLGPAHGNGALIGGGPRALGIGARWIAETVTPWDMGLWVRGAVTGTTNTNWRMRKVAQWTCYGGDLFLAGASIYNISWPEAFGIPADVDQEQSLMKKNCGLFFAAEIPQQGFGNTTSVTTGQVAEFLDQTWVCGRNQYPGGCDPTYSFRFAINATRGVYNPQMDLGNPRLFGYKKMIYSSIYDGELLILDTTHVKDP